MVYYAHSFQNSVLPFLEDLQDDQQKVCLFADFSQFHSSTLPMAFRRPRCSFVFTYLETIRFDIRNNFCFIFRRFLLWNLGRHLSWIFVSSVVRFGPGGGRKGSEGPGGAGDPGGPEGGWTWSKIVIWRWRRWNYKSKYRFTRSRPNDPRCPFSPLGLYPSSNEPKAEINAPGASHKCRLLIGRPDWTDSVSLGKCVRSHEISSSQ